MIDIKKKKRDRYQDTMLSLVKIIKRFYKNGMTNLVIHYTTKMSNYKYNVHSGRIIHIFIV